MRYDENLWVYLKKFKNKASKLDLSDRLQIISRIGKAVKEIQKSNLVHLDLKPSNILLMYDTNILQKVLTLNKWNSANVDNLVLADFGLSGDLATCSKNAGTPGFASPEQMIGQVHKKSDLYSFGKLAILVLFEWDTAWSLMAQPKTEPELKLEKIYGTKLKKIIAGFLQVSR